MKTYLLFLFSLVLLCASVSIYGQASAYVFTYSSGSYTAITDGTILGTATVSGSGATALDAINYNLSDGTIPFSFVFNGTVYTGMNVRTDGYITFGATQPGASAYSPISASTTYDGAISAVGANLQGRTTSGSLGEISYKTTGSAPNREFVIQFKNFRRQASSYTADVLNFQIRIVETSNAIKLVYDAFTVTSTSNSTVQVGLRGATNSDYNNRTTTSNWASTTAGTSNSASCRISNTVKPSAGVIFTWTLPTVPPSAAVLVSPDNGGSGVYNNANLNWANGGYFPTGYKLFFGTDNPPTNIVYGVDLGNATTYTPTLNPETQYYWRIQPYNAYGDNTAGTIWTFTTAAAPMSGTFTVGTGGDYTTMTSAINAINSVGASSTGVTFQVLAGEIFNENPPAIIASGSETGLIVFEKSGSGVNPVIKSTGTAAIGEYVIKFDRTDYITFNGIDIANLSGSDIEYGYWIAGNSSNGCIHNIIENCRIELSTTNTNSKGIYIQSAAGSALTTNSYNKIINVTINNAKEGINITGSNTTGWEDQYNEIDSSTISNCSSGSIVFSYQQNLKIHDSTINLITGSTTTVNGIYADGSTTTAEIYGNTVTGSESPVTTGLVYGIYLNSVGNVAVHDNRVNNYIAGTSAYGLYLGQGISSAYNNNIHTLTGSNSVYGVYTFASNVANIYSNNIYELESLTSTTGKVYGIYTSGTTFSVYNNMISKLRNANGTSTLQIYGIYISSGTNSINYNSVLLDASSNDATFTTAAIYATTAATQLYISNNIFVNNSVPGISGKTVAFYRSSTGFTNINVVSGYNIYYAGTPDAQHLVFFDGTNSYSILADYKNAADPRDAVSFSENVPFISNTDLHINSSSPTVVESSGAVISGINTDLDGELRNEVTPDIGADEGSFSTLVGAPGPAVLLNPDNEAINVSPKTVVLDWDVPLSGGAPTGYALFISDSYSDLIAQSYDYYRELEADVTDFSPFTNGISLTYDTDWYWAVIPFNTSGLPLVSESSIWSFHTIRAPLSGIKTINPTGSGTDNYTTFTSALNDIALLGLGSGGVIFEVKDGAEFTEEIPAITVSGTASQPIIFRRDNSLSTKPVIKPTTSNAGIQLVGSDYISFDGIDVMVNTGSAVNYGFSFIPVSASNGAQYNEIKNCSIVLNKDNINTKGIYISNNSITPTSINGTNSNNKFTNITIENSAMGFYLNGSTSTLYPDSDNEIGGCTIGGADADDMAGNTHGYGVNASYEKNLKIHNNEIRNFSALGNSFNYGIYTYYSQGALNIYNNKIHNLRGESTTSGNYSQYGMYIHLLETETPAVAKIYNNMIWDIESAYTGVPTTTTLVCGIYLSVFGSNVFNIDFNTVKISGPLTANSACFYYNSASTGIIKARNNIFANYTPNQTGSNVHYCIYSPLNGYVGNTGSISDYNILYVEYAENGYIGKGGSALFASLTEWNNYMYADYHSKSVNPRFIGDDVHISNSIYTCVESNGNYFSGVDLINWVNTDIDNNTRNAETPDIGADEGDFIGTPVSPNVLISRTIEGNILLHWDADPAAIGYRVFSSSDVQALEPWTLLGYISINSYLYIPGNDPQMFFKVVTVTQ